MTSAERARKICESAKDILRVKTPLYYTPSERWNDIEKNIAAEIGAAEREAAIKGSANGFTEGVKNGYTKGRAEGFREAQEMAIEIVKNYNSNAGLSEEAWWSPNIVARLGECIKEMKP